MHPLVARIHPSYRTALTAWLFSRALCWGIALRAGWGGLPLLHAPSYREGAPLWSSFVVLCRHLESMGSLFGWGAGTWTAVVAGELALLVAAVAIYRFVRHEDLPQTAERATWMWAFAPAMALTIPVSSWNFAVAGVALALAAVRSRYFWGASAAIVVATAFRAEAALVGPGFVWVGYRAYRPQKDALADIWAASLAPLAGFTAAVGTAMLLAGRWGISIRTLHPVASWRTDWEWSGLANEAPLLVAGAVAVLGLIVLVAAVRRDRGEALVAAGPVLVWPVVHDPAFAACGALLMGVPAFAAMGRRLDDPSRERALVAAFVGGLALWLV